MPIDNQEIASVFCFQHEADMKRAYDSIKPQFSGDFEARVSKGGAIYPYFLVCSYRDQDDIVKLMAEAGVERNALENPYYYGVLRDSRPYTTSQRLSSGEISAISISGPMSGQQTLQYVDNLKQQMEARDLVDKSGPYFQSGNFARAEELLRQAIQLNPHNGTAHCNLGVIYYRKKRYSEAIPWLEKALAINPGIEGVSDCLQECRSLQTTRKWWQIWK